MGNSQPTPSFASASPLKEFSVVYTDRALNLMAQPFREALRELLETLTEAYGGDMACVVPGAGTFAMEAVARQFAGKGKRALVAKNGLFGHRWVQILEAAATCASVSSASAWATSPGDARSTFAPVRIEELCERIAREKPDVVFASHVETTTGIMLPDSYICAVGEACHKIGSIFVLDCIASGAMWINAKACGVDVLVSAPQKGWSGPACCGFVVLAGDRVKGVLEASPQSSSFALDLKAWFEVARDYRSGGFKYYTTLPTDALVKVRAAAVETKAFGWERARAAQLDLGLRVRAILAEKGRMSSVAAPGFEAPGVVVVHVPVSDLVRRFADEGLQVAAGLPFKLDEDPRIQTFRVGLFGLDKLAHVEETAEAFERALDSVLGKLPKSSAV